MLPAGVKQMMASPSSLFTAYASFTASMMLVRTMINDIVPRQLQSYIWLALCRLFQSKQPPPPEHMTLVVEEHGVNRTPNEIFEAAELYLSSKIGTNTDRLKISKCSTKNQVVVRLARDETIVDTFDGIDLKWKFVTVMAQKSTGSSPNDGDDSKDKKRHFELSFDKKYKDKIIGSYIPFVIEQLSNLKDKEKTLKMFTLGGYGRRGIRGYSSGSWGAIDLEHPSTFDTLAMETELKKAVMKDLDRFLSRREFYKRVGRAFKRGYLLYGPPGTGKSSLVAAMANYVKFDVYDLQLSNIRSDSQLRQLLLDTGNRSILVIEDIDCSIDIPERSATPDATNKFAALNRSELTLSGLLNFIDGLWSSCGDERIIVFTTNHVEKLDPALLRPGRMDMHIHMSYCTFQGFKLLASNYLEIPDTDKIHRHSHVYTEIEGLIAGTKVTPAEVAEEFMKSDDPGVALNGLVKLLEKRKMEDLNGKLEEVEDAIEDQVSKKQKLEDELEKVNN